ncbi:CHAT domain-containing protein [Catalinimonas alkaloidigena]|uniref:CHAT domain-containing protein n=1 Tax=Catalinimonas alkaloidigena TaxID=1075417 RepID=UPI002406062E|nr:CHAT domain-containing tetratricopeptide repeat protein [Catalinimonas alkaloidigena]MDF9797966.1 CHAT domain-containing protein [Catalinimonas alkaloidigena]
MQYYFTLIFLLGIQICIAAPYLNDTVDAIHDQIAEADQYKAEGRDELAIQTYESAKKHLMALEENVHLVKVLNQLASLYSSDTTNWSKAIASLDTARLIFSISLSENDTLLALTWITNAELNIEARRFTQAIECYLKALEIKKDYYGENHLSVAELLEKIGGIYLYDLQNPYSALSYFERFVEQREKLGVLGRSYINGYYSLASASRHLGDYDKALAYAHLVRDSYENLDDVTTFDRVISNSLLANIYYDMDSINDALNFNKNAITYATLGQILQTHVIPILNANQARFFFRKGEYDSTISFANQALKADAGKDITAKSYQFLGNAYWKKGRLREAFRYYRKSKEVKEHLYKEKHTQLATLYVDIGRAFATAQQTDSAIHYYQKGLQSSKISDEGEENALDLNIEAGDDLETIQEALHAVTDLLFKQYLLHDDQEYLEKSLPYFKLFDRFMGLSRANFTTEGSKLILSANYKSTYEKAIAACYQLYQSQPEDSLLNYIFQYMEKSKAMVLLESIQKGERYKNILPDSLTQREQSLKAQLAYLESEITAQEQKKSELLNSSALQIQKANVLRELELYSQHIESYYPNFHQLTHQSPTVTLDRVRAKLTEDQALISYCWGDTAIYVLMIATDTVKVHQVHDFSSVQVTIERYQDVLVNDDINGPSYANFLKYQESAYQLYQLLLAPVIEGKDKAELIIVLDGDLTTIPFESFVKAKVDTQKDFVSYEKLPFLIHDHEISYEFSASIAFGEKQRKTNFDDKKLRIMAFGINDFNKLNGDLPSLIGAEREVRYVQQVFPEATVFLNEEATEKRFKQNAPGADILHIATHGIADMANPFASHFIFFPDDEEDGNLNLYELYSLPLQAKLLLLTACESGLGKHFVGEGNFSLARSFVYAGCKSVLMSLWQIDDFQTQALMNRIYNHLAQEPKVSKAIRNAKLDLINESTYAHPQCWAGVVPLGNAELTFPDTSYQLYIFMGLIVFSLTLITIIYKTYRSGS